jgi:hypothetical protein
MDEDRKRILQMLGAGKITAEEAESLLDALSASTTDAITMDPPRRTPKYLRVLVDDQDGPTKVNVRIPMQLLRAGMRLSALIPPQAQASLDRALKGHGATVDLSRLKPEDLEELVANLGEMTVDVADKKSTVRVFAE